MFEATIIIFGASGDLATRSLVPALYKLFEKGNLRNFFIFGAAIDQKTSEEILNDSKEFIKDFDSEKWHQFSENYKYQKLDFKNFDDYKKLAQEINSRNDLPKNRLIYCSAGANFFEDITINSVASGLIERTDSKHPWQKMVFEKPFGFDLKSAEQIHKTVQDNLDDNQVFRVDHFLGDELLANVSYIRFTNTIFEAAWNNKFIESVEVCMEEKLTILDRGRFYDHVGALVDVIQNHVLQMFALTAMERPKFLTPEEITQAKTEVLKKSKVVDGIFGQYEGYKSEKYIDPNSETNTFALLKIEVDNDRWKGVPFYLKSGKALNEKDVAIKINFKKAECPLLEGCLFSSDSLEIRLAPEAGFKLNLNAKAPEEKGTESVSMDFMHKSVWPFSPKAYEVILKNILIGNRFVSVSFEEIKESWKIIEEAKSKKFPMKIYAKDSSGPSLS